MSAHTTAPDVASSHVGRSTRTSERIAVIVLMVARALADRAGRWPCLRGFITLILPTTALAFFVRPTWLFEWVTQLLSWRGPGDFTLVNPPATLAHALHLPSWGVGRDRHHLSHAGHSQFLCKFRAWSK